jgi:predicted flap endonuclease-1-like 5' DNA nuclease
MLALKIICCLTAAFILGAIAGYLLGRIRKCEQGEQQKKQNSTKDNVNTRSDEYKKTIEQPRSHNSTVTNMRAQREREMQAEAQRNKKNTTLSMEVGKKPTFLEAPEGEKDDLKKISGIGPKIETTLNELGIFHYRQIAEFSEENIAWIDNYLSFRGRIKRDNWVGQADILSQGEETDFSKRYKI